MADSTNATVDLLPLLEASPELSVKLTIGVTQIEASGPADQVNKHVAEFYGYLRGAGDQLAAAIATRSKPSGGGH